MEDKRVWLEIVLYSLKLFFLISNNMIDFEFKLILKSLEFIKSSHSSPESAENKFVCLKNFFLNFQQFREKRKFSRHLKIDPFSCWFLSHEKKIFKKSFCYFPHSRGLIKSDLSNQTEFKNNKFDEPWEFSSIQVYFKDV